jgi:adenylate kinase family enzyme
MSSHDAEIRRLENVIRERFKTYRETTTLLIDRYKKAGVCHWVDGMRDPAEVSLEIRRLLEAVWNV